MVCATDSYFGLWYGIGLHDLIHDLLWQVTNLLIAGESCSVTHNSGWVMFVVVDVSGGGWGHLLVAGLFLIT